MYNTPVLPQSSHGYVILFMLPPSVAPAANWPDTLYMASRPRSMVDCISINRMVFSARYVSFCPNSTAGKPCKAQSVHHHLDHKFDTHIHHHRYPVDSMVA
jgi:hypothetical protein